MLELEAGRPRFEVARPTRSSTNLSWSSRLLHDRFLEEDVSLLEHHDVLQEHHDTLVGCAVVLRDEDAPLLGKNRG